MNKLILFLGIIATFYACTTFQVEKRPADPDPTYEACKKSGTTIRWYTITQSEEYKAFRSKLPPKKCTKLTKIQLRMLT